MRVRIGVLLPAIACCLFFAAQARATDYVYGYTSLYVDSANVVRGYHRTELDYNTEFFYTPYVCASLYTDDVEVRACQGGYHSATRNTQTAYSAGSVYSALSDHYVNILYEEEDPNNPGNYYFPDVLGYSFSGEGSYPVDWYFPSSYSTTRYVESIRLGDTYVGLVGVAKIQYQNSSGLVDIPGTLYVLKDTEVTFQAIPDPANMTFPNNQPVWSGTSGATGTGTTKAVTFSTISSTTTDNKTVIATAGTSTKTVNVIVYSLTGVLTPSDNFAGRSTVRFGLREDVDLTYTVTPSVTVSQMGGLGWTLASGDGTLPGTSNGISTYTAPLTSASATLKLNINSGPSMNQGPTYAITIVEPNGAYMIKKPNTSVRHTVNKLGVGFLAQAFLTPVDVSFDKLGFSEGTATASAYGFWASLNSETHGANGPFPITDCNINTGCLAFEDVVDTNDWDPPFSDGSFTWVIPWRYVGSGTFYVTFTSATHYQTAETTGRATIQKGGAGAFAKNAGDSTSSY